MPNLPPRRRAPGSDWLRRINDYLTPTVKALVIVDTAIFLFFVVVRQSRPFIAGHLALGPGFFAGEHRYNFPRQGNQTALRIDKPGIYFLGSFKYKTEKSGMFEAGKFSMQKVNKPTEAELLKRILDEGSGVKDSAWRDRIQARLKQIK